MRRNDPGLFDSLQYCGVRYHTINGRGKMDGNHKQYSVFGFVIKGQIAAVIHNDQEGGAVRKLLSGELFYLSPQSSYTLHNPLKEAAELLLIDFLAIADVFNRSSRELNSLPGTEGSKLYKCPFPQMHHWLEDFDEEKDTEPSHYYWLQSHLYAMASTMLNYHQHPEAEQGDLDSYIRQIRKLIVDNIKNDLDIEQTARLSGVSPNRFYKAFKQATGLSPHKFMTYVKLNASLSLLAAGPASIMSVAHNIGYTDELYFSRLFKKHMGLTPTEYAQASQQSVAILSPEFQGDLQVLGLKAKFSLNRKLTDRAQEESIAEYALLLSESNPDLILACPGQDRLYENISERCNVLELDVREPDWKGRLKHISDKLGILGVADRWLKLFENKAANAAKIVGKLFKDEPCTLIQVTMNTEANEATVVEYRLIGANHYQLQQCFYGDVGITAGDAVRQIAVQTSDRLDSLAEQFGLEGQHIIFIVPPVMPEKQKVDLEEQWRAIHASSSDQICLILECDFSRMHTAHTYENLLDQLMEQMISGKFAH